MRVDPTTYYWHLQVVLPSTRERAKVMFPQGVTQEDVTFVQNVLEAWKAGLAENRAEELEAATPLVESQAV